LNGISVILGRDWLNLHQSYINYKNNRIYFLENHCLSHCPSAKGNKFIFHNKNITATILQDNNAKTDQSNTSENVSTDQIIPTSVSEDEIFDSDICAAIHDNLTNTNQ